MTTPCYRQKKVWTGVALVVAGLGAWAGGLTTDDLTTLAQIAGLFAGSN